jgi:hypothetical protein
MGDLAGDVAVHQEQIRPALRRLLGGQRRRHGLQRYAHLWMSGAKVPQSTMAESVEHERPADDVDSGLFRHDRRAPSRPEEPSPGGEMSAPAHSVMVKRRINDRRRPGVHVHDKIGDCLLRVVDKPLIMAFFVLEGSMSGIGLSSFYN